LRRAFGWIAEDFSVKAFLAFALLALSVLARAGAQDLDLFDTQGNPVAYVDVENRGTIFLWSGKPVAYLLGASVYGFNGAHLGWLQDGSLYGHGGEIFGLTHSTRSSPPALTVPKGERLPVPLKLMRDVEPLKPAPRVDQAGLPLEGLLALGAAQ
jgi:hypothetical protein